MRHQNALHTIRFTIVILLLSVFTRTNAQVQTMHPNTPMGTYVGGFFQYLPVGYSTSSQTYPLLIFIHGMGEIGVGDSASLEPILLHGPPMLIDRGTFPQTFSVDGQTFSFIVLSPQFSHWPTPNDVNDVITYAKAHYRVDPTRIYLTGLSMGGGSCWDYAAENSTYANTVTAIVPTGAASEPSQYRANILAAGNVGVWAFHNDGDLSVPVEYTINWVNYINNAPTPPVPPAKMTIFHQAGHDAWTAPYDMTYTENGLNIYQWMLQFQKGRPFSANIPPLANAGANQTVNFPDNTTLNGSGSKDPDGSIASYTWSQAVGPTTATLSSTAIPNPAVSNLVVGLYRFKLTVVDNRGAVAESFVDINVTPHTNNFTNGLAHVEAETYSYFNSVMTQPTSDVGGGLNAGGINAGSWMDYYINVPATGSYTFRARVASPYDGDQLQFKDSNGVVLSTVALPNTNGWQTWQTATSTVTLQAGLQRFRVYCPAGAWNFNWFELQQGAGAPPPPPPPTSKIVVNAGANQVITLPTSSVTLSGSATDSGSTINAYQWTLVSGPSTNVTFSNAGAAQTTVNGLMQGTYIFQLRATDALGTTATASTQIIVNAAPANKPPVVSAGSNQSITLPTNSVTLTGTASDPDGSVASTTWSQVSGPNTATIASPAQLQTNITGLIQGSYVFQLLAKDNAGATTTATATVTVNAAVVGSKITVNAGSNQTITLPVSSVTLTGSASDSGSTISTYAWSQVSGPAQASFNSPAASSTSATGLVQGTYTFQFKATDALGNSATSTVQVTVNPAVTPPPPAGSTIHIEAESFATSFSIMTQPTSDAGGGLNVGGINTGSWMDYNVNIPTSGSYTFSVRIASPYPGNQLQLRKSDGTVLGTINIPVTDGWQIYTTSSVPVTLTAGAQTLRIVSTNGAWNFNWFELAPGSGQQVTSTPTTNAGSNQSITLPTNSATLTGTASDVGGTITSYQWTQTSGPNTATFGTANAAQTTVGNLVQGVYVFQLKVTDNLGATANSTTQVTVNAAVVSGNGTPKYINVQVYGGSNPYVSSEWNNWNVGNAAANDVTSGTLNYSDGTASSITSVLSNYPGSRR
jgi:Predicted peptidase